MPMGLPHRIAIVDAGLIGSALAGHLILAGNKVIIGARRPDAFTPPDYQREDIDYPVRTIEEAIDGAGSSDPRDSQRRCRVVRRSLSRSAGRRGDHRSFQPVPAA